MHEISQPSISSVLQSSFYSLPQNLYFPPSLLCIPTIPFTTSKPLPFQLSVKCSVFTSHFTRPIHTLSPSSLPLSLIFQDFSGFLSFLALHPSSYVLLAASPFPRPPRPPCHMFFHLHPIRLIPQNPFSPSLLFVPTCHWFSFLQSLFQLFECSTFPSCSPVPSMRLGASPPLPLHTIFQDFSGFFSFLVHHPSLLLLSFPCLPSSVLLPASCFLRPPRCPG